LKGISLHIQRLSRDPESVQTRPHNRQRRASVVSRCYAMQTLRNWQHRVGIAPHCPRTDISPVPLSAWTGSWTFASVNFGTGPCADKPCSPAEVSELPCRRSGSSSPSGSSPKCGTSAPIASCASRCRRSSGPGLVRTSIVARDAHHDGTVVTSAGSLEGNSAVSPREELCFARLRPSRCRLMLTP
jgi:hypothetical protein